MKTTLKVITLVLAISATAQSVMSYAEDMANLPELIQEQEAVLTSLLSEDKNSLLSENERVLTDVERKELIIKNMVHYIRLIEGQETLLEELKEQHFPDLDINRILTGKQSPTI